MADRATVFQTTQIGVETTPGTAVPALKRFSGMELEAAVKPDVQMYRPTGQKYSTTSILNKEWTEFAVKGIPLYSELQYPLASVFTNTTPTIPGGGTLSRLWTFSPSSTSADSPKTFTIEQGDPTSRAHRASFGLFTELGIEISRSGLDLKGTVLAQSITDGIQISTNEITQIAITGTPTGGSFTITANGITTGAIAFNSTVGATQTIMDTAFGAGRVLVAGGTFPGAAQTFEWRDIYGAQDISTLTTTNSFTGGASPNTTITTPTPGVSATALPNIPVAAPHVAVYLADTQSGLAGATMMQRCIKASWTISDRFGPIWALNRSLSYPGVVETVPKMMAKIKVEADAEGMGLLTTMRANATKFIRIQAIGAFIEGALPYTLQIDMAGRVSEPSKFEDEDGLYALEWTLEGVTDPVWGHAVQALLQNTATSL